MSAPALTRFAAAITCAVMLSSCASAPAPPPPQLPPPAQPQTPPATPQTPEVAQQNPTRTPPELGPPKTLLVPPVVERTLPNGLRLLIIEHHELPVADLILVVRTGSEADPRGREGLATLTASMLDEGTTSRTALQIADRIAFLGIQLGTGGGWDATRVSLHSPTAQLDSALALMADVVLHPSFPEKELERLRRERLTSLLQQKDFGPALADLAFSHIVFGEQHPYGRPQLGNEKTVRDIARADIRQFYTTHYRPNNSALVIVGDVRPDDIQHRVERLFGSWPRGNVPSTRFTKPAAATQPTIYLIDKPGAAQSSFRLGTVGVERATQDYFPILVMNTILGASFTSRLNQNLRETKGYTYGARSGFDMRRAAGPFTAQAEIVTAKSDSALIEFLKELRGIHQSVPAAELDKAKNYLQLQLPSQFESTNDIAAVLVPIALHDLPLDYFASFSQRIAAVSAADVERVAQQYVRPDRMHIVILGDLTTIEQSIRALGIGKVERRDLSGRPIVP
jgi:zinc protease